MNRYILMAILLFLGAWSMPAQNSKHYSESYLIEMFDGLPSYVGTITYTYAEGDDIKSKGSLSLTGDIDETRSDGFSYVKIKGGYKLGTAYKNNRLNGPFSIDAKYHFDIKYGIQKEAGDYVIKMKGAFVDGQPDGNFTAKLTDIGSVNINYKDGILVGPYFVDALMLENAIRATIKGQLTQDGEMTGTWEFNTLQKEGTMEFLNGVSLDNLNSKERIELAKQYAKGEITENELKEKGIAIELRSLNLGEYASDIFYRNRLINWKNWNWKNHPSCDFGRSQEVKYKQLHFYDFASESFINNIIAKCKRQGNPGHVEYDKFFNLYRFSEVLITDDQLNTIIAALDEYNRPNSCDSFMDFLKNEHEYHSFGVPDDLSGGFAETFNQVKDSQNIEEAMREYNLLLSTIDELDADPAFQFQSIEKTADGEYYRMPHNVKALNYKYLSVSSVDDFQLLEKQIRDYKPILEERVKETERRQLEFVRTASEEIFGEVIHSNKRLFDYELFKREYIWEIDRYLDQYHIHRGNFLDVSLSDLFDLCHSYSLDQIEKEGKVPNGVCFLIHMSLGFKTQEDSFSLPLKISVVLDPRANDEDKNKLRFISQTATMPKEDQKRFTDNKREIKCEWFRQVFQSNLDLLVGKSLRDLSEPSDVSRYLDSRGHEVSLKDLKSALKPFLPLLEYQIESIDIDDISNYDVHIVTILTVQHRRKTIRYRLPMTGKISSGQIYLSSFDKEKAQKLE